VLFSKGLEKDLQLILPEFLLFRFIEEGEFADMVNKDVAQDGEVGI
jgi:hypothetical protein